LTTLVGRLLRQQIAPSGGRVFRRRMICQWCKQDKDETEFHWKFKNIERLKVCKDCRKIQSKRYRDRSKEKRYAYNKWYRENRTDKLRATQKRYRESHKEEMAKYWKEHVDNFFIYRNNRKDKAKIETAKWHKDHPEKCRYYTKLHNARVKGAKITDFTMEQWDELIIEYNYRCTYCGKYYLHLEQDHIQPLTKGGDHTKSNIVPACKPCNSSKKDKSLTQWRKTAYYKTNCSNSKI
jgi:hypothetical protein